MRKALLYFVTLILCLSLSPYGKGQAVQTPSAGAYEDTTEVQNAERQAKIQANIDTFYEYISTYPNKHNVFEMAETDIPDTFVLSIANVLAKFETDVPDTALYGFAQDGATALAMEYILSDSFMNGSLPKQTIVLYLRGGNDQQEGKYYISCDVTFGSDKSGWSAVIHADPATFAVGSEGEIVNFTPKYPHIKYVDGMGEYMLDGVHTTMELFDKVLRESQLNLTLEDFGFESYTIDASRKSDIRAGKHTVEPAPLELTVCKLDTNSIGTPTMEVVFKNTGSKAVEAFEFYVRCYDAFGDVVKRYGVDEVSKASYQVSTVQPGKETQRGLQWPMYGINIAKNIEVAVFRYKLVGESDVTIPDSQLVWWKSK